MAEKKKSKVSVFLKLAISLSILGILINQAGAFGLWAELKKLSPFHYTLVIVLSALRQFIGGWRWQYILSHTSEIKISIFKCTQLYFIAVFVDNFIPGVSTGDVVRPLYLNKIAPGNKQLGFATVIYERLLGFASLVLLAFIASVYFALGNKFVYLYIIGGLVCVIGVTFYLYPFLRNLKIFAGTFMDKIFSVIDDTLSLINSMLCKKKLTMNVFLISLLFQVTVIFMYWLNSQAIHASVSFYELFVAIPLGWIVAILPFALYGLGIREGAICFLLSEFHIPTETALAIALLFLPAQIFCSIIGALFFNFSSFKIDEGKKTIEH